MLLAFSVLDEIRMLTLHLLMSDKCLIELDELALDESQIN